MWPTRTSRVIEAGRAVGEALARGRLSAVAVDAKTSRGGCRVDGSGPSPQASPDTAGTSQTVSARPGMQLDHAVLAALALGV
jgi:hypothetical protein